MLLNHVCILTGAIFCPLDRAHTNAWTRAGRCRLTIHQLPPRSPCKITHSGVLEIILRAYVTTWGACQSKVRFHAAPHAGVFELARALIRILLKSRPSAHTQDVISMFEVPNIFWRVHFRHHAFPCDGRKRGPPVSAEPGFDRSQKGDLGISLFSRHTYV
jgi:hypothetical protein